MQRQFDAKYFIEKFSAIPEDDWTVGTLRRVGAHREICCALGHCGMRSMDTPTEEAVQLTSMFARYGLPVVPRVNDSDTFIEARFPQLTPKARILAALDIIQAAGG